jgi:predicted Holliday junction resolvase-like endonuclease
MLEFILGAAAVALAVAVVFLLKSNTALRFRLRSSSVKHGKTMEQLLPFSKEYPYDPRGFRFIGDPVDGVQFNEDGIVFVEFKTGESKLSVRQAKIKENVKNKKVEFREIRN